MRVVQVLPARGPTGPAPGPLGRPIALPGTGAAGHGAAPDELAPDPLTGILEERTWRSPPSSSYVARVDIYTYMYMCIVILSSQSRHVCTASVVAFATAVQI